MPSIEIEQTGRGGTVTYREGAHVLTFDWEFAGRGAVALLYGTRESAWDVAHPWAAGRMREIFECVGREVVDREVPGGTFDVEWAQGVITVRRARERVRSEWWGTHATRAQPNGTDAWARFRASAIEPWQSWPDGATYDVSGSAEMTAAERDEAVGLLTMRDATWREIDALAVLDTPAAREAVRAALGDRLSVATRIAAAQAMARWDPSFDLADAIAQALRAIHRAADGLERVLRIAATTDTPTVRQALLYASWNQTECSSACAALLLWLANAPDPSIVDGLALHRSYFERKAAFDALCAKTGLRLES